MNNLADPATTYTAYIGILNEQLDKLKKKKNTIAWARLLVLVLAIIAGYYLYEPSLAAAFIVVILLLAVFIRLVVLATNNKTAIENTNRLIEINQQELSVANGNYTHLPGGEGLAPADHDYAHDLDIFGRASIFQYINRTNSQQGSIALASWLTQSPTVDIIIQRQAAIKELAPQYKWRQQLQAYGMEEPVTVGTADKIGRWLKMPNTFSHDKTWQVLRWIYPVGALGLLALHIAGIVSAQWFYGMLILFIAFSSFISKLVMPQYLQLNKIVSEVSVLSKSAWWIEKNSFQSSYLNALQKHFTGNKTPASTAIQQLKGILDRFDYRLNPLVFIPLNALVLWDLQLIFQLERWRKVHELDAPAWFTALGEAEAISSLATVHFNHPDWALPVFDTQQHGTLEAKDMGHPLIMGSKRINSSFYTKGEAQLSLITGSNMAGKSTFLRSTGVNIILAMAGAPVCANSMRLSPMHVISSMRVADNLEESTSTFYAELKKLKRIIEAVNRHEKVFLLLDEILRGTNSLDRHTGSKALIKQLIEQKAVGMLATHDLDLAKLIEKYPSNIHNYHFDVQIANDELYFDYKLKEGVCTSLNASILMKKIGIEIGDQ
jgi:hypothetical protein